jgi:hypothetical protein
MIMITTDDVMKTLYQMSGTQPYMPRTYATTVRKFTPDPLLTQQEFKPDPLFAVPVRSSLF